MNARISSVVVLLVAATACGPRIARVHHPLSTAVQLELGSIPRVWIAGFVAGGAARVDLNGETVRVLGDELRSARVLVLAGAPRALANEEVFSDQRFWQKLGEEHDFPLIITGSIKLLVAPARMVQRGRRETFVHASGRILRVGVVLIDGRTGRVVATQQLPARSRYGVGRFASETSLYFDLLHQTIPDWLRAISLGSRSATPVRGGVL